MTYDPFDLMLESTRHHVKKFHRYHCPKTMAAELGVSEEMIIKVCNKLGLEMVPEDLPVPKEVNQRPPAVYNQSSTTADELRGIKTTGKHNS